MVTSHLRREPSCYTRISLRQADVIPVANPLQHEECGASAAAVRYQMRAPRPDRPPALARLEFDLLIGITQGDPHPAVQDLEGVLDVGVVVPGDPLRGAHPQLGDPESRAFRVTCNPLGITRGCRTLHEYLLGDDSHGMSGQAAESGVGGG